MSDLSTKGDQARTEILDAARRLFLSQGYHGTSMRAIAQEAGGRAVAGIYNHFATKEAIFRALIEECNPYDELFGVLEDTLSHTTAAPDFVRAALRGVMRIMPRHMDFFQLVQIDMREFGGANIGGLLINTQFPRIWAFFERLQQLPGLRQPLDQRVLMRIMASLMIGYVITDHLAPITIFHEFSTDEWAEHFADALLYGLMDDESRG